MDSGDYRYIWEDPQWPQWKFDLSVLAENLMEVSRAQGHLLGRLGGIGFPLQQEASLRVLTEDVLETSRIEGEVLDRESVRSSIARRLGVDIGALAPTDRHVEGVVEMVLDATKAPHAPLTKERLFTWHAALFPTGISGPNKIRVGAWRDDANGPMRVVSGPVGRERVHFEAPPADRLDREMTKFLEWVNKDNSELPLIKAGLAYLWFVTLHPFEDGNGRIARAIGDMLLARADGASHRFYSLSAETQKRRTGYYENLENTQKGTLEVTNWLGWFLDSLLGAVENADQLLSVTLAKAHFWQRWVGASLNERQVKVLNRLLDGFEGKLTSSKWAAITKTSQDTALRDISELLSMEILRKLSGGGRSVGYELVRPE